MQSLRQAPQPREKFPSDAHKMDSDSIMKAGVFMAQLPKEQSAAIPKQKPETPQEISQRILSLSEENFSKARALFSAEPQPKTRQEQIERLFGILKDGGTLGMHYAPNEGESKTPAQVLSSMKGDCDELALLFIASARKLGIDTSDMGVAVLGFVVFGKEEETLHATALTIKGENYLLDLTHASPEKLESVDARGLTKAYENRRLATGDLVLRVGSMEIMSTPEEMVSVYFRGSAAFYERNAKPDLSAIVLPELEKAIQKLETAFALNLSSPALSSLLFGAYADAARECIHQGNLRKAGTYSRKAISLGAEHPDATIGTPSGLYDMHNILGQIHFKNKIFQEALEEFAKAEKFEPLSSDVHYNKALALYFLAALHSTKEGEETAKNVCLERAEVSALRSIELSTPGTKERQDATRLLEMIREKKGK